MAKEEEDPDEKCGYNPFIEQEERRMDCKRKKANITRNMQFVSEGINRYDTLSEIEKERFNYLREKITSNEYFESDGSDYNHAVDLFIEKWKKELQLEKKLLEKKIKENQSKESKPREYIAKDGTVLYSLDELIIYNKAMGYTVNNNDEKIPYHINLEKGTSRNRK